MKRREEQANRRPRTTRWTLDSTQWRQQWILYNNRNSDNVDGNLIHQLIQEVSHRYPHQGNAREDIHHVDDVLQMLLPSDVTKRYNGEASPSVVMIKSSPPGQKDSGDHGGTVGRRRPLIKPQTDVVKVNNARLQCNNNAVVQLANGGSIALTLHYLRAIGNCLEIVQEWQLPQMTFLHAVISILLAIVIMPHWFAKYVLYSVYRLTFGTLYPAYASYKAVRTKNVKEYVST